MRRKLRSEVAWEQWEKHTAACRRCARVRRGEQIEPCPDGLEMLTVWKMWQRVELEQTGRG